MKNRTTTLKTSFSLILLLLLSFGICAQKQPKPGNSKGWVVKKPFQNDVFIQNNGQFTKFEKDAVGDSILYYTKKGRLHLYFTANALTIGMDSLSIEKNKDEDTKQYGEEAEPYANLKSTPYFLKMNWAGANPNVQLEVIEPVNSYFTYPNPDGNPKAQGIIAHAWKRLIYHNLYPGIDMEFFYPEKGGLEYTITVHPGADPSVIKMNYSGNAAIALQNNNVHINWVTAITDHAPTAKDENGNDVNAAFRVNTNVVSFDIGNYDKSKNLVIDPWITTTSLGGTNQAYDIGYDMQDNVYVYGGGSSSSYELQKYNSGGFLVWTYTSTFSYQYSGAYFYGDLTVDARTGTSYMCEGFNGNTRAGVVKVNSNGIQAAAFVSPNVAEIWRINYDYCNNQLVMALGAWTVLGNCVATLDTNCTVFNNVNALNETQVWDNSLLGVDNAGKCYIASDASAANNQTPYGNLLYQVPLPSLAPTAYIVSDKHDFVEIASISYYPRVGGYAAGNGMNGLAATPTKVFTYDGGKMREWQASNGALLDSAAVSGTYQAWGGISLDCEDNIYCGNNHNISVYDTTMNLVNTIAVSNTVYDVAVSPHGYVYACGNGYVQCIKGHKVAAVTVVQPSCSGGGSITASPCGKGPFTYLWSNGATTSSITGLTSGSYTVTVNSSQNCAPNEDTAIATLIASGAGFTFTCTPVPINCNSGNITTAITGGTNPFTFSWSNGATTSNLTAVTPGPYTLTVIDASGCKDSASITLTGIGGPTVTVSTTNDKCFGDSTGTINLNVNGGTPSYTYNWTPVTGTNSNLTGLSAGTYSCTVSDAGGCRQVIVAAVTNPAQLRDSAANIIQPLCSNGTGTIAIGVKGGTGAYTYSWNPGGGTNSSESNLTAATYTVTVTDSNGCSATSSMAITPPTALNASISPIVNVKCAGTSTGSATVNAGGGTPGYTYSWSNGNTSTNITGLSAGTYSVTVTDNHGCVFTASATITQPAKALKDSIVSTTQIPCHGTTGSITIGATGGTGSYSYSWAPSGGTSTSATGLTAAVYTVTVTDSNGCTANVTDTLKPSTTPIPVISGNDSICKGSQVTLTVTGGGTYLWSPGGSTNSSVTVSPTSTTTYTVHCTNGTCSSDTTFTVIVVPIPSLSFSGNTVICKGSSTPWTASGGTTYTWTPSSGLSCSNCPNPTASPTVTTTYTLQVSNGRCSKDTTIKMTVANKPVSFITQNPTGCICKGSCATLTASGGGSYLWLGGSNQVDSVIHICPTKDSIYSVQVDKVCKDTAKLAVCIDAPNFIVCCDTTIQINGSAPLSVVYSSSANVTYSWSPSTGLSCTACPNPVANPTVTTTYTVTMTDSAGCSTATDITVDIACDDFTMPNIFTPNNDGINDDFVPYYYYNGVMYTGIANLSSYSIKIFDRWGVLVYSSTDPKAYWNGRINGTDNLVPDGTYYYMIDATCQNSTYKKKGFVQVLTGK